MRGAVAVSADLGGISVLSGGDRLSAYTFNTGVAKHYFCSVCGIYTHHQRRSNRINTAWTSRAWTGSAPLTLKRFPFSTGRAIRQILAPHLA